MSVKKEVSDPVPGMNRDEGYSELSEIEDAFDRVSSVADALLDSIRDDSLRGKQRRESRKGVVNNSLESQDSGDEDDSVEEFIAPNFDDNSILTYGDEDDVSLDGSLAQDMKQLKSVTRAIKEDLSKEDREFHENVSTGSGRSYFARKEKETETKTPVFSNIETKATHQSFFKKKTQRKANSLSFRWDRFEQFCNQDFGEKPNLPLLLISIVVWLIFCRIVYNAKLSLMDDDGYLLSPTGLLLFSR